MRKLPKPDAFKNYWLDDAAILSSNIEKGQWFLLIDNEVQFFGPFIRYFPSPEKALEYLSAYLRR